MHNVVDSTGATRTLQPTLTGTIMTTDNNSSQSTSSSPKSTQTSLEGSTVHPSGPIASSTINNQFTPPSSVESTHEQHNASKHPVQPASLQESELTSTITGKKRTANGRVKEASSTTVEDVDEPNIETKRASLKLGSGGLSELSQSLKTRLAYAMVKVQNGWQKHSIEEVESLASHSPRSTMSVFTPRNTRSMVSPRSSLNGRMSGGSNIGGQPIDGCAYYSMPVVPPSIGDSPSRRSLAPPATIVPGQRRRPTPNINLQINSTPRSTSKPKRPTTTQRTPSQNAAMEADAVETLLFMSTSPNNSGHFPSHLSAYSPTSQVFSTQTSPLKTHFEVNEKRLSAGSYYSPRAANHRRHEDKTALIDRLLHDLDDDESEELDRAVKIMEQHRATKLSA